MQTPFLFPAPEAVVWQSEKYQVTDDALSVNICPEMSAQEYRLTLDSSGLRLTAGSRQGAFYGRQTLKQIFVQSPSSVYGFDIWDKPDYEHRGLLLDISRCKVPKMSELKRLVDLLAMFKYNQFQLYIEHTFAFKDHQTVWRDSSPLTAADIRELDAYCREHFIELVPNFNSFGHLERWLKHDEYAHLADNPGGISIPEKNYRTEYGNVLHPDEKALEFLDSLYSEYLPNFSSSKFNIGCDEVWELEYGKSRAECERRGMNQVYLDFIIDINKLVRRYQKDAMVWGDVLIKSPDLLPQLPQNMTLLLWGYEADHDFTGECSSIAKSGHPFYVCPGTSSWNSFSGRINNCLKNLKNAAESGLAAGAEGYLVTDWGDNGHLQYPPVSWPGICAGAAFSWNLAKNSSPDVVRAIDTFICPETELSYGDFLFKFGSICDVFQTQPPNRTPYCWALFDSIEEIRQKNFDYTVEEVHGALDALEKLSACIPSEEMENACDMVWCALQKMLQAKGENINSDLLASTFENVIQQHKKLWLQRNRPGGLAESAQKLEQSMSL